MLPAEMVVAAPGAASALGNNTGPLRPAAGKDLMVRLFLCVCSMCAQSVRVQHGTRKRERQRGEAGTATAANNNTNTPTIIQTQKKTKKTK